jgi:hypothetical protein
METWATSDPTNLLTNNGCTSSYLQCRGSRHNELRPLVVNLVKYESAPFSGVMRNGTFIQKGCPFAVAELDANCRGGQWTKSQRKAKVEKTGCFLVD